MQAAVNTLLIIKTWQKYTRKTLTTMKTINKTQKIKLQQQLSIQYIENREGLYAITIRSDDIGGLPVATPVTTRSRVEHRNIVELRLLRAILSTDNIYS
jgi:hypothetical protein